MMNMKVKKMVASTLVLGALIPGITNTYASAANIGNISTESISKIQGEKINRATVLSTFRSTDRQDIEKIAKEHNIPLMLDGKSISRIETEFVPYENIEDDITTMASIGSVTNHGSGWYNASSDLYANVTTSGPDTLKISKTESFNATMTNSFGASASNVSAKFGFTIGQGYSVTFSSSTPVERGQRLNVKAYTTHLKKSAPVYSILGSYKGTVYGHKPNGTYFLKTWY